MVQYPDTISFSDAANGGQDGNGNWVAGNAGDVVETDCRYEPKSGNGFVTTADGERVSYSGVVYLPLHTPYIKEGSSITVTIKRPGEEDSVLKEKVLRFSRGQFNCRCWL